MSLISAQLLNNRFSVQQTDEAEDKAITTRPSSTALLTIDSVDRWNGSFIAERIRDYQLANPYSFTISRSNNIMSGFFTRLALTEIVFPYIIPNVNNQTNTIQYLTSSSAQGIATIPIGWYSPFQLANAVQSALRTASGDNTITITWLPTMRFLVQSSAGTLIQPPGYNPIPPTNYVERFTLFDLMGGNVSWTTPARYRYGNLTRCRFTEYVDIVCSQLTDNQDLKDTSSSYVSRDAIARIYIEQENDTPAILSTDTMISASTNNIPGTYPFTIYRQFKNPKFIRWNKIQPINGALKFEVYDDRGQLLSPNIVDTGNEPPFVNASVYGMDWRMTLLVSEN